MTNEAVCSGKLSCRQAIDQSVVGQESKTYKGKGLLSSKKAKLQDGGSRGGH